MPIPQSLPHRARFAAALVLILSGVAPLNATTIVHIPFDRLVTSAGLIAEVTVLETHTEMVHTPGYRPSRTTAMPKTTRIPQRMAKEDVPPPPWAAPVSAGVEPGRVIFTHITLAIDNVIKGKAPAVIHLRMPGGEHGGLTMVVHGLPRFAREGRYLLLLSPDYESQGAPVVGFNQGFFRIEPDPAGGEGMLRDDAGDWVIGIENRNVVRRAGPGRSNPAGRPPSFSLPSPGDSTLVRIIRRPIALLGFDRASPHRIENDLAHHGRSRLERTVARDGHARAGARGAAMTSRRAGRAVALLTAAIMTFAATIPLVAYNISTWWPDSDNVVMDDIFLPAATWAGPAESQLLEWNEIDRADLSHPFLISSAPEYSFGSGDNDNTMGFLDDAGLQSQYGISYATAGGTGALAVTVTWASGTELVEADIMVDPSLPWSLGPDDNNWFQSTMLHEAGHARGLGHHQVWQSIMNDGTSKLLRDETLYMDDMNGIRQHATAVQEVDIVLYPKSHNGTGPQWMTTSATTLREGQPVTFSNWSFENRGSVASGLATFEVYLANTPALSPPLTLLNTGNIPSSQGNSYGIMNWTSTIPTLQDCTVKYVGAIAPSNPAWNERFEQNNTVAFTNGSRNPVQLSLLLARDRYEPNDAVNTSYTISRDFSNNTLSLDSDTDHDWYTFYLPKTMTVVLDLSFTHALGDIDLELRNTAQTVLAASAGTSNFEHIQIRLASGYYRIHVYGYGTGACNRYSMTLHSFECLQDADCPGATGGICGDKFCSGLTNTCVQIIPPCSDGDPCTQDLCFEVHGGYCLNLPDPTLDPEGDGFCSSIDNCPNVYNPGQEDTDGDGIGDACEI